MSTQLKIVLGVLAGATFMFMVCAGFLLGFYLWPRRAATAPASPTVLQALPAEPVKPSTPITPSTFDAMSRVEIPSASGVEFGRDDFSIMFWFKSTTPYRPMTFLAKRVHTLADGWVVHTMEDNSLLFYAAGCATAKGPAPDSRDGKWHHLAAVRSGNALTLYLDAKAVGRGEITCSFADKHPVRIGMDAEPNGWHLAGEMAEVHFYKRALDGPELEAEWNGGRPMKMNGRPPGLAAGYHLGDEAKDLVDFMGSGANGLWITE